MGVAAFVRARDLLLAADGAELYGVEVCERVVAALHEVASFEWCALMTTDPTTLLPSTGVVEGFPESACGPFWETELTDPDFAKFTDLARSVDPVVTLYDAVDGDLARSPRFQKLYGPLGAGDELRVAFVAGTTCLAVGSFLRPLDAGPFPDDEVADVRQLLPIATKVLRRGLGRIAHATSGQRPAVILLDGESNVAGMTEGAGPLLADLRLGVDGELPGTVRAAVTKARWSRTSSTVTTQLRGNSGRWLRVHVAPMQDDPGTVAVTIEPARPDDLALILLGSYGLTDRETEVVLRLCRGLSTKDIASELMISTHTVRDHVKAIFDKAGVASRGELVASLFTSHLLDGFHHSTRRLDQAGSDAVR